jgi:hypothetical protein
MEPEVSLPRSQELYQSWARPIQSTTSNPISVRSIVTLSTHLCLGLPSGLFPSGFPINNLYALFPHSLYMPRQSHPSRIDLSNYTWRRVQIAKLLVMQLSLSSHHFISFRCNYSTQYPLLKHHHSTKNGVFWVVTPCGSWKNWRFGGTRRFLRSVLRLLVAACVVPSSPIFVTLMKEAPGSSETSVLKSHTA